MRLGIAHHLGWAVLVAASDSHEVVARRSIETVGPDVPAAPIEHDGQGLDDAALAALVRRVRRSIARTTSAALDDLTAELPRPVVSMSLRSWPLDFPDDISTQRRPPYDSRADSVMYRQVLADLASDRGWDVCLYDARTVEREAAAILGPRAETVLHGPRTTLGPPWAKDHRMALAATVVAVAGAADVRPNLRG